MNMRNKQQKKRFAAIAAFCMALFGNGFTAFCQTNHSNCIKQVESYYATLNDFSKYSSSMSETAVVVYFAEGNIVYNDLRTFQAGRSIDKQKDIKAYLVTLKTLSSSEKVEFKATVKKSSVRTKQITTEDYKGNVVILDVSKTIKYKGETKEFDETITMYEDGQIVKIETSPHFHIPWHEQIGLFDPLDKEWNFQVWGSTKEAFGVSMAWPLSDYFSLGFGYDGLYFVNDRTVYYGGDKPDFKMKMVDAYVQTAANFSYWSVGLNAGWGYYYSSDSWYSFETETWESPKASGMVLTPFASINVFGRISLSVGYNFNLFNGKEFNGLKFGLGVWLF